ncbi:adenylate/guanylate cyclase domain-containing protein [Brevibacterium daeguense]|uniref:adenylate/guanylate cyclase domain-containing protein n=1 Tax=Brevibacterium daeguense TaxID=909936 RepID=UPI001F476AD3
MAEPELGLEPVPVLEKSAPGFEPAQESEPPRATPDHAPAADQPAAEDAGGPESGIDSETDAGLATGPDADVDAEAGTDASDFFRALKAEKPRAEGAPKTEGVRFLDEYEVGERERAEIEDTIYELRSAAQRLEERLLGGKRVLTRREVAGLAEVSTLSARKLWRSLGFPRVPEGEAAFTVADVRALREVARVVATDLLDEQTVLSLMRATGQTTDRLVVWQMETLVEYLAEAQGLEDSDARRVALDLFEQILDPLEEVLVYAWKRNLAGALGRLNVNVTSGLAIENRQGWFDSSMPLARAVGFVDLVSYTRLSQQMEPKQLAFMVKRFQDLAYNIVATGGGRVIKTVGDEVFFAAETPHAGAEIALTLQEEIREDVQLPKARVGFAWGKVLSRLGDIFGSTVNLAARLTAVADPGTVVTDSETANVIQRTDAYEFTERRTITLQGLGEISVMEMDRGTAEPLPLDFSD